jgi:hypothetical protein
MDRSRSSTIPTRTTNSRKKIEALHWPTWAGLRGIGNSSAVRASIIVPVIGYLIILNSTVADFLKLHGIEWAHQPASVWDHLWSLKLYLVYFGLMFLGVGAAIYQWQCPPFVKKYGDWADYVAGVAPHADRKQIEFLGRTVGRNVDMDELTGNADDHARSYLRQHYAYMSKNGFGWRVATTVLFASGFALLSIPSFMTAVRVAIALITS